MSYTSKGIIMTLFYNYTCRHSAIIDTINVTRKNAITEYLRKDENIEFQTFKPRKNTLKLSVYVLIYKYFQRQEQVENS